MAQKSKQLLVCPKCGAEYLPCEIFYPKEFFGGSPRIVKNAEGKMISPSDNTMQMSESYECDYCHCMMQVQAKIGFTVKVDVMNDFSEDYSAPISNKMVLDED